MKHFGCTVQVLGGFILPCVPVSYVITLTGCGVCCKQKYISYFKNISIYTVYILWAVFSGSSLGCMKGVICDHLWIKTQQSECGAKRIFVILT